MKCKCGNKEFIGNQMVRAEVIVDENGEFIGNINDDVTSNIYDAEDPYGPFICTRCGREYDDLEGENDEEVADVKFPAAVIPGYEWEHYSSDGFVYLRHIESGEVIARGDTVSHTGIAHFIIFSPENTKLSKESYWDGNFFDEKERHELERGLKEMTSFALGDKNIRADVLAAEIIRFVNETYDVLQKQRGQEKPDLEEVFDTLSYDIYAGNVIGILKVLKELARISWKSCECKRLEDCVLYLQ